MGNVLRKPVGSKPPGADQHRTASSNGLAQAFLRGIELDIYVGAFEVTGYDAEDKLQKLTPRDLDRIECQSHVPILPSHRARILAASKSYVAAIQPPGGSCGQTGTAEATFSSTTATKISPPASACANSPAVSSQLSSSSAAGQTHRCSRSTISTALHGLGLRKLTPRDAASTVEDGRQEQGQQPNTFETVQPNTFETVQQESGDNPIQHLDSTHAVIGTNHAEKHAPTSAEGDSDSNKTPVTAATSLSLRGSAAHTATQQQLMSAGNACLLPDNRQQSPAEDATTAGKSSCAVAGQQEGAQASSAGMSDMQHMAKQTAAGTPAAAGGISKGFSFSRRFKLLKTKQVPTPSQQQPSAIEFDVKSPETAASEGGETPPTTLAAAEPELSSAAATVAASPADAEEKGPECIAAGGAAAVASQDSARATAAADLIAPAVSGAAVNASAAASAPPPLGIFRSFKRVCSRPSRTSNVDQEPTGSQQQQQQAPQPITPGQTDSPTAQLATAKIPAAAVVAAVEVMAPDGTADQAVAAPASCSPSSTAEEPLVLADLTAAAAADLQPVAGPLTVHRTALNARSISSRLPPIGQKRKVPTAWSEVSTEVNRMAYAVTAPLAAQPLPAPLERDILKPAGVWAGLPSQVDHLSYAATAPLCPQPLQQATADQAKAAAAAGGAWAELATEVSMMSYASVMAAGEEAKLPPQQPQQHQQQQQRRSNVSSATLQARCTSDPGCVQGQQQQQQPMSARSERDGPTALGTAVHSGGAHHSAAVTAGLPPSAQQLHEQLLARLKAQGPGHSAAAEAAAAAARRSCLPGSPSEVRFSYDRGNQAFMQRVQQAGNGHKGSHVAAAGAAAAAATSAAAQSPGSAKSISAVGSLHSLSGAISGQLQHNRSYGSSSVPAAAQQQRGTTQGPQLAGFIHQGSPATPVSESSFPAGLAGTSRTVATEGSTTTMGPGSSTGAASAAGSTAIGHSVSARPGSGARASDVRNIVHKAKERAAARQRLPMPFSPSNHQQEVSCVATTAAAAADLLDHQQQSSGLLCGQQPLQVQSSAATPGRAALLLLPGQCSSDFGAAETSRWTTSAAAAAAAAGAATVQSIDGDRAVRMLQDFRTITELDRTIKARVSQLTTPRQSIDGLLSSAGTRSPVTAVGLGSTAAAAAVANNSSGVSTGIDCHAKQQRGHYSRAAAVTAEMDSQPLGNTTTAQRRLCVYTGDHVHDADGTVAVGLLGITEALDNSYDAGKACRSRGAAAAAAAAATAGALAGYSTRSCAPSSSSRPRRCDPYSNPFISPVTSPEPAAEGVSSTADDQCGNPFLRESLVLETPVVAAAAAAAAAKPQQQQCQGLTVRENHSSSSYSSAIGQHPGVSKAVVVDIAAKWLAGKSAAPTESGGTFHRVCYSAAMAPDAIDTDTFAARTSRAKGVAIMSTAAAAVPGAALAGSSLATAAAAAQTVDERIKRIVMASRARTAAAKAAAAAPTQQQQQQQQEPHVDVLTGVAAADQGWNGTSFTQQNE